MKRMIMIRVVAVVLCFTLLAWTPMSMQLRIASAQGNHATQQRDEEAGVKVLSSQVLEQNQAARRFAALTKSDEELQALSKHLGEQGYRAQTKSANYFGWDIAYQRRDGQTARVALLIQDYAKGGSKDPAAIGTITITAGTRSDTYTFSVIAPDGNFEKATEHKVDKESLKVVRANSFWTCFVNRLRSRCAAVCIGALGSCLVTSGGSWASYLGCLAIKCGGCAASAFACCLCDCSWWCRWAVGCCHR